MVVRAESQIEINNLFFLQTLFLFTDLTQPYIFRRDKIRRDRLCNYLFPIQFQREIGELIWANVRALIHNNTIYTMNDNSLDCSFNMQNR